MAGNYHNHYGQGSWGGGNNQPSQGQNQSQGQWCQQPGSAGQWMQSIGGNVYSNSQQLMTGVVTGMQFGEQGRMYQYQGLNDSYGPSQSIGNDGPSHNNAMSGNRGLNPNMIGLDGQYQGKNDQNYGHNYKVTSQSHNSGQGHKKQSANMDPVNIPVEKKPKKFDKFHSPKEKEVFEPVYCEVCDVTIDGHPNMVDSHFNSKKHLAKVKSKNVVHVTCEVCNVTVEHNYEAHIAGKKHQSNLKKKSYVPVHCGLCNFTPKDQYTHDLHFKGKKHALALKRQEKLLHNQQMVLKPRKMWDTCKSTISCMVCKEVALLESNAREHFEGEKHLENEGQSLVKVEISCDVCNLTMTCQAWADGHFDGELHKLNVAKKDSTGQCQDCNRLFFTEEQLKTHLGTKRHAVTVERKAELAEKKAQRVAAKENWVELKCDICNLDVKTLPENVDGHFNSKRHSMSVAKKEKREQLEREKIECDVCKVTMFSETEAKNHYDGKRHQMAVENNTKKEKSVMVECETCDISYPEWHAEKHLLGKWHQVAMERREKSEEPPTEIFCDVCRLTLNSDIQAQTHFEGNRHKTQMERKERNEKMELESTHCQLCDLDLRGEAQKTNHFSGKKHRANVAKQDSGNTTRKYKFERKILACYSLEEFESKLSKELLVKPKVEGVPPLPWESADNPKTKWFKYNELICGICIAKLHEHGPLAAKDHFSKAQHSKLVTMKAEEKWEDKTQGCPVCLIQFKTISCMLHHYAGKGHPVKMKLVRRLGGLFSAETLKALESETILSETQPQALATSGKKRRSDSTDEGPPAKSAKILEDSLKVLETIMVMNCMFCKIQLFPTQRDAHMSSAQHLKAVNKAAMKQQSQV